MTKIIQDYPTMDDYWQDYELINNGQSLNTYWDTYENGYRNYLEKLFAKSYHSEASLLVNSGMASILATIESQVVKTGDVILTGQKSYFETTQYLSFLKKRGVKIVRVNSSDYQELKKAIIKQKPKICLLETVINSPEAMILDIDRELFELAPNTLFVVDNSVQSNLTRWFEILPKQVHSQLIVLESLVKYYTETCMAGCIYGTQKNISNIKSYAQNVGVQLQQRALEQLDTKKIANIDTKLKKISRNVALFKFVCEQNSNLFEYANFLDSKARSENQRKIFDNGVGSLAFIKIKWGENKDPDTLNRELINRWKQSLANLQLEIKIRAGFGFDVTSVRNYEDNAINQPDAPRYIRISIGTEEQKVIDQIFKSFILNIKKIICL